MVAAAADPVRLWILPFAQRQTDEAFEYLEDALPALLAVAVSRSDDGHTIVEREELDVVLDEQALSLAGLSSPETRQRVGQLLGATVIVTGSFLVDGQQLVLTMRASDLETGIVSATADGRGAASQPGALIVDLYRRLARNLGRPLPALATGQVDEAPQANLHFMKGLGHYFGARYNHSIAEFMLAGEVTSLTGLSRFWLAKAYLAQRQYSHACLELARLTGDSLRGVPAADVAAAARECEPHLSSDELRMIRDMAGPRARTSR
jgi:hypothetical protein